MAIGEFKQHHGHEPGGAWWGCTACNPVDDSVSVRLQPLLNKEQVEAARIDAKVYALLDAAEDFKTAFPGGCKGNWLSPDMVVTWLEKRAERIEEEFKNGVSN